MRAFYNKGRDRGQVGSFNRTGSAVPSNRGCLKMGIVQVVAKDPRIPDAPLIGAHADGRGVKLYAEQGVYRV